jgi:hypothetical protein
VKFKYWFLILILAWGSNMQSQNPLKNTTHLTLSNVHGTAVAGVCPSGTIILNRANDKIVIEIQIIQGIKTTNDDYIWLYVSKGELSGDFYSAYPVIKLREGEGIFHLTITPDKIDSGIIKVFGVNSTDKSEGVIRFMFLPTN